MQPSQAHSYRRPAVVLSILVATMILILQAPPSRAAPSESEVSDDTPVEECGSSSREIFNGYPEQHFCCDSVSASGSGSGEGCAAIGDVNINDCTGDVLFCAGSWTLSKGKATCVS